MMKLLATNTLCGLKSSFPILNPNKARIAASIASFTYTIPQNLKQEATTSQSRGEFIRPSF